MTDTITVQNELDLYIDRSRNMNLMPVDLLDLQTHIAALRYTLGTYVPQMERRLIDTKHAYEMHTMKQHLRLKAKGIDPNGRKYTNESIAAEISQLDETERLRLAMVNAEIDLSAAKGRLMNSKDVGIALQARIGIAKDDMISSRIRTSTP